MKRASQERSPDGNAGRFGRRRLLRDAGFTAVGAGVAVAVVHQGSAEAAPGAVTAINVKEPPYAAAGDGSGDDRGALQGALDGVDDAGGAVYFPPGDYVVSGPLEPKSRTLMFGSHTPKWEGADNPDSASKIRAADDFSGDGLIRPAPETVSVTIRNLALAGNGDRTAGVHGLRMPDLDEATGESSWMLEDVTIAGFSGDGIYGRIHVAILSGAFIHNNRGWGINASNGNRWNDAHVANCFFFYNRRGNLYFGGSETSAAVDFVNCRFERAGTNPDDVLSPLEPASPGVRLANAQLVELVNCNTDANTGNGVEIVRESEGAPGLPANILLANCRFNRDGSGDSRELGDAAGVKVRGLDASSESRVNAVKIVNCFVGAGRADDRGGGDVIAPRYGVWYENTHSFQWIGGNLAPAPQDPSGEPLRDNAYFVGEGANEGATIVDIDRGLLTLPLIEPGPGLPVPEGAIYFDAPGRRLRVRRGDEWLSVDLAPSGEGRGISEPPS